ncbi:MAG: hypothetical protein IJ571_02420 [Ruminococcus sp.]|nr:hypothetical protein [Ruminococcus sp.]
MKEKLKALEESVSLADAERLSNELASFDENYSLSDDEQQRILSSVMRKAGIEMKRTTSVKRTKKRTIFIALIAAAAACLSGITAYAVYHYNYGNAFKSKAADNGETISGDINELESTTQPFNGVVLENTFKDIDITVEGIVSDIGRDYALVTARKTDGTAFAEGDEKRFEAGLQMCIPYSYMDHFKGKEINDASQLHWGQESVNCELNDDGSLSITIANDWKIGDEDYDIILGFGDIFSFRYSEEMDDEYINFLNSLNDLDDLGVYNGAVVTGEYDRKLAAHKKLYRDLANEYYEGSFIIKAHISENDFIIEPEENDYGMRIVLSGMTCTIKGDGKNFLELAGTEPDDMGCGNVDVTFRLDNGEENTVTSSFSIAEHSYITDDGFIAEADDDRSAALTYTNFSQFTDPYKVTEILINGRTLWKSKSLG